MACASEVSIIYCKRIQEYRTERKIFYLKFTRGKKNSHHPRLWREQAPINHQLNPGFRRKTRLLQVKDCHFELIVGPKWEDVLCSCILVQNELFRCVFYSWLVLKAYLKALCKNKAKKPPQFSSDLNPPSASHNISPPLLKRLLPPCECLSMCLSFTLSLMCIEILEQSLKIPALQLREVKTNRLEVNLTLEIGATLIVPILH